MKKYKKLLMVAPLACMLGTGVVTFPTASHADAAPVASVVNDSFGQGSTYSTENITQALFVRLRSGIEASPELRNKFKIADDERIQHEQNETIENGTKYPATNYGLRDQLSKVTASSTGTNITVNPTTVTEVEAGKIELLSYRNSTPITQKQFTTEKSMKRIDTVTATNQYGFKLGFESSTNFKVNALVAQAEQSFKASAEFNFSHTDTNTATNEETVTFKAQEVLAAPGGTTNYFTRVGKANFSGSFQTDAALTDLKLKLPIVKKDNNQTVVHTEEVTLTSQDIYTIFKNTPYIPLPAYLSFDDNGKKVLVKNVTFNYIGEMGYNTSAQAEFIPFDQDKPKQTMSYEKYETKTQDKSL
ncbi:ETX/MTX2 family pore-forming toxin [Bacillus sp. RIT 809]|uniref:ETX/MTX2 family pore-forming toxin n=1 Tax=Bacillus sp. RIT 809 TaxID=2803857 RepID=UPI001951DA97|nr:ETX/MTX2 family pore-forming toxin [Bacillus sp. RIT 809]MBM6647061.1 ETX/MTX2 family pore-forming toxin [Bacillus sp. RIT 809]